MPVQWCSRSGTMCSWRVGWVSELHGCRRKASTPSADSDAVLYGVVGLRRGAVIAASPLFAR